MNEAKRKKQNAKDSGIAVGAVLIAFMEKRGVATWTGTEEQLFDELTRFKDDPNNLDAITDALRRFEKVVREHERGGITSEMRGATFGPTGGAD